MAIQEVGERVGRLETVLESFIQHSDAIIAEIRENIAETRQWRAQSEKATEEMRRGTAAIREDIAEIRQWRVQSQKQWGEIAQKMGSFVEDIVAPNIPRIGREVFGLGGQEDELFSSPRLRLRNPKDSAKMREFDYLYATTKGWVIVESKKDPRLSDIDDFLTTAAEAREYFPQYAALPLYPIFASLYVPDHAVNYCTRRRVYALGMGAETMQLLNLREVAGGK